jgi:hypothetical protein
MLDRTKSSPGHPALHVRGGRTAVFRLESRRYIVGKMNSVKAARIFLGPGVKAQSVVGYSRGYTAS